MNRALQWLLCASMMAVTATAAEEVAFAKKIRIKLGTLAPEGSPWFDGVHRIGARWKKATHGDVVLKVYPGGVAGDEDDMLRKIRIGQLHAASVTGIGLSRITRDTLALQIPMMIRSYDELDYLRAQMGPRIRAKLREEGFVVLHWGDAGWVHFFSKKPVSTPEELAKLKLFVWSGDPASEAAWKAAGFNPVPMSATDVLSGLQTGLVESFATTPLYALTSQWFGLASNMVEVRWAPLNGATVVSTKVWDQIPAEQQATLLEISEDEGKRAMKEVRELGTKAVKAMTDRGLKVTSVTPAQEKAWQSVAEKAYATIRGQVVEAETFDEVQRLIRAYRQEARAP